MKNILLIIEREYLTRVKKKSFIIMSLVAPLLVVAMYGFIFWAAMTGIENKKVAILDETGLFVNTLESNESFTFVPMSGSIEEGKESFVKEGNDALVYIPKNIMESSTEGIKIFAEQGVSIDLQSNIERKIEAEIENIKLKEAGIDQNVLESSRINVNSQTLKIGEGQEEKRSSSGAATIVGFLCGFLIYISVIIYGAQVMRGVMEEKTSRIVEVIISSVKPFELLLGKIIGIAMVGLTQFLLWIVLSFGLMSVGNAFLMNDKADAMEQMATANMSDETKEMVEKAKSAEGDNKIQAIMEEIQTLPVTTIIVSFLFYFLGGYMLYSSLFGAVGSAVDSETDTQQFMMPITLPIIASFLLAQFAVKDPDSSIAFWASMVPFSSPIVMMVRIPFGVPVWQIVLSISLLIAGFLFTTWLASRIYRIGILMYGKKASWKELSKWIFYKP